MILSCAEVNLVDSHWYVLLARYMPTFLARLPTQLVELTESEFVLKDAEKYRKKFLGRIRYIYVYHLNSKYSAESDKYYLNFIFRRYYSLRIYLS